VLRAGLRTPTPAGLLSALRAAHGLVARYTPPAALPDRDDDAEIVHVVIPIGLDERWCGHCGEVVMAAMGMAGRLTGHAADCCRRPQPVPVLEILQPEEYYLR
jgi:hypothetical protein